MLDERPMFAIEKDAITLSQSEFSGRAMDNNLSYRKHGKERNDPQIPSP
jgi:hypothetical protein